jgi:hypothetical protein
VLRTGTKAVFKTAIRHRRFLTLLNVYHGPHLLRKTYNLFGKWRCTKNGSVDESLSKFFLTNIFNSIGDQKRKVEIIIILYEKRMTTKIMTIAFQQFRKLQINYYQNLARILAVQKLKN